jgi:hypothetical protein
MTQINRRLAPNTVGLTRGGRYQLRAVRACIIANLLSLCNDALLDLCACHVSEAHETISPPLNSGRDLVCLHPQSTPDAAGVVLLWSSTCACVSASAVQ